MMYLLLRLEQLISDYIDDAERLVALLNVCENASTVNILSERIHNISHQHFNMEIELGASTAHT